MTALAGAFINAADINNHGFVYIDRAALTADSTTWTNTESGSLHSITVPVVNGLLYYVQFTFSVATDTQTFPLTQANMELAIMRLKEDSASGTQMQQGQYIVSNTSGNGFQQMISAFYVSDATENKQFHVTGQRNSTGSSGNQRIEAGSGGRSAVLTVWRASGV